MRVFELARSLEITSADVLEHVEALDFEATTAVSTLESDEIAAIRERCVVPDAAVTTERADKLAAKRRKVVERRKARDKAEAEALAATTARAKSIEAIVKGLLEEPAAKSEAVVEAEPAVEPVAVVAMAAPVKAETPVAEAVKKDSTPVAVDKAAPKPVKAKEKEPAKVPATKVAVKPPVKGEPTVKAPTAADKKPVAPVKPVKPKLLREADVDDDDDDHDAAWSGRQQPAVRTKPSKGPAGKDGRRDSGASDRRAQPAAPQRGAAPRRGAAAPGFSPVGGGSAIPVAPTSRVIQLHGAPIVKDLAELMGLRANRVIADLMQMNVLASINQRVEIEIAEKIADKYGYKIELERQKRSTERKPVLRRDDADDDIPDDKPEEMIPRPPIVTFLGHVDHGKTSLMDRIRNAHVASGEAGGITQHIGAYTVDLSGRQITFLDTPGHAAFSAMRARGASLTDIAVIIIAADDCVMPQTKEAIKHAKQAGVQIMVAINKCDLPQAKPDQVRQQLAGEGLTPEDWGGDIVCCEVSAMTGEGVDHLLEMILLQADVLELTANPNRRADGYVIEAQLELGLGPTASLLVAGGTLRLGDIILCGEYFGRIRGLIDDRGRKVKEALPSTAVRVMGLSGVPEAGAHFRVMLNEKRARELAEAEAESKKHTELTASVATSLDALMEKYKEQEQLELHVIVKADTQGSCEAIEESLRDIESKKVSLQIIYSGIGNVNANDVQRAASGRAVIVGFHVSCEPGVQSLARHDGVRITTHRIIYELLDQVKQEMLNLLEPEYREVVRGHAEIRAVFNHGKRGMIAGCQMLDGVLRADSRVRVLRKKTVIFDGKIASLHHFQDEVAQVDSLQECGVCLDGFEAFTKGDVIESYILEEKERVL